jgi:hypothetical protein
MRPARSRLLLALIVAALLGFGAGWCLGTPSEDPLVSRAHAALHKVRNAFHSLTR